VIFLSTYHPSGHRNPDDYNVGLKIQEAHWSEKVGTHLAVYALLWQRRKHYGIRRHYTENITVSGVTILKTLRYQASLYWKH
jgi:hypothetical protein